jgi:hypothetical protein
LREFLGDHANSPIQTLIFLTIYRGGQESQITLRYLKGAWPENPYIDGDVDEFSEKRARVNGGRKACIVEGHEF